MSDLLKHKILNYEVPPPPANWEAIAERLTDDDQHAFLRGKMYDYSAIPPAGALQNILAGLDAASAPPVFQQEASVRPLFPSLRKIAAAAAILIVIAGAWIFFTQRTASAPSVANRQQAAPAGTEAPQAATAPAGDTNAATPPLRAEAPVLSTAISIPIPRRAVPQTQAPERTPETDERIIRFTAVDKPAAAVAEAPIVISSPLIHDDNAPVVRDMRPMITDSKYMMISGPDGSRTRLSAKFASVMRYLNEAADAESGTAETRTWTKRFRDWRNKIAASTYIPACGNYLDIMEFKDLLRDN